jgi:hypothetical protein
MAAEETHKHCKNCDETKSLDNFYKAGAYYQCLCKPCHNGRRYLNRVKKHPFDKYPETKHILEQYFPKSKSDKLIIPMPKLADMTGVKLHTLRSWRKKYDTI